MTPLDLWLCPCSYSPGCCWPLLLPGLTDGPCPSPCPPGPPGPFPQSCSQQLVPAHTRTGLLPRDRGPRAPLDPDPPTSSGIPLLSLPMAEDTISAQPGAISPHPTDCHWFPAPLILSLSSLVRCGP